MVLDKGIAKKTAELLLQINAIKLEPENPFTWASGWKSPIYCDNRIMLSYPMIRNFVREEIAKQVEKLYAKMVTERLRSTEDAGMKIEEILESSDAGA